VVSDTSLVEGWPAGSSAVVFRVNAGMVERVAEAGDLGVEREWASVSKMAVSLAFGVEVDWGLHRFDEQLGPRGATLAHLLSHSSGLGLEEVDPVSEVGTKRVYSNYAVDYAVQAIVGENDPANWLDGRVFQSFGMSTTRLEGRASSGVVGSTEDLLRLAVAWLRLDGLAKDTRDRLITPFLPQLSGVVPGFGRFTPCPWGLGPEVRGQKQHWMGDWSEASFGHFGQSGAMMLLDADEQIGIVATSTEPFGAWAHELWPRWTSAMRRLAIARD
jgi:CubicO group peptidase (beta-lactamase class C family)